MTEKSLKKIVRIITVVLMVCFFIPTSVVSCSGQELNVTAANAMFGYATEYQQVTEPEAILSILLLIPLAVLVLTFIKRVRKNGLGIITIFAGVIMTVTWTQFKSGVENVASYYMCEVKMTGGYTISVIASVMLALMGIVCLITQTNSLDNQRKCSSCGSIVSGKMAFCTKCGTKLEETVLQNTNTSEVGWRCSKCGMLLKEEAKFCQGCGTPKSE